MVLMEHPESKVLYVGSVDESVSTPSRAQGLRELDIVTSMDGLDRLELQAFGLKSSRMKRLIEKRPLHLTVERGPPVNVVQPLAHASAAIGLLTSRRQVGRIAMHVELGRDES